jgi:hypothetical protein
MSTDNELLRSIVKEALREALGGMGDGRNLAKKLSMDLQPAQVVEVVSLANDTEVKAFVNRVLDMAAEPQTLGALRDGRIVFQLSQQTKDHRSDSMNNRIDRGALTESSIMKAAEAGSTVIVAWKVVVTSLAREKARDLGVTIIRESKQENQRGSVMR